MLHILNEYDFAIFHVDELYLTDFEEGFFGQIEDFLIENPNELLFNAYCDSLKYKALSLLSKFELFMYYNIYTLPPEKFINYKESVEDLSIIRDFFNNLNVHCEYLKDVREIASILRLATILLESAYLDDNPEVEDCFWEAYNQIKSRIKRVQD